MSGTRGSLCSNEQDKSLWSWGPLSSGDGCDERERGEPIPWLLPRGGGGKVPAVRSPVSGGGPAAVAPQEGTALAYWRNGRRPECPRQSEQDGCGGQCAQSSRQQAGKWDGIHWTVQSRD